MDSSIALVPLADTMTLGKILAESGFFPDSHSAAQAVVKVLAGRELGFGAVASMTGINIIQGRVALSANLIAAAVKRNGRYNYQVIALDDSRCTVRFFEQNKPIGDSTFTAEDAKRAGTKNMERFPRNMLFARAMSNGAKWFCADIFGGPVYTPDELGATVNEEGEVIDMTPKAIASTDADNGSSRANNHDTPSDDHGASESFDQLTMAREERAQESGDALITPAQIKLLHVLVDKLYPDAESRNKLYIPWLKGNWKVESSKDLTSKQASQAIDMLTKLAES